MPGGLFCCCSCMSLIRDALMKKLVRSLSVKEIRGLYVRSELAEHGRLGPLMTVDVLCVFRTLSFWLQLHIGNPYINLLC
jgi:hypothetical protein